MTNGKNEGDSAKSEGFTSSARDAVEDVFQEAKDKATYVKDETQEQVKSTTRTLQDRLSDSLTTSRRTVAHQGDGLAQALRRGGDQLRERNLANVADYGEQGAERIEQVTGYLRSRPPKGMLHDLELAAERSPVVVYGGLAGLAALAVWAFRQFPAEAQNDTAEPSYIPTAPEEV